MVCLLKTYCIINFKRAMYKRRILTILIVTSCRLIVVFLFSFTFHTNSIIIIVSRLYRPPSNQSVLYDALLSGTHDNLTAWILFTALP